MMMRRTVGVLLLITCVALVATFWKRMRNRDAHAQMVALLQDVLERTPFENKYLGNADLLELNEQIRGTTSISEKVSLLWARAPIELRLGKTDDAIVDLKECMELVSNFKNRMDPKDFQQFEVELYFALAVANFRKGETENCVYCRTGESCILPIKGSGVHTATTGSQEAIRYLREVLQRNPTHLTARWLLNVANMTLGTYPQGLPNEFLIAPATFESQVSFPRFENVASTVGLDTFGLAGGTAVDDFDGDGLLDVIASDWNTSAELRYFRNEGNGVFADRSHEAGFKGIFGGLNVRHADYDNDGDLDILVLRGGWMTPETLCANSLLENNGKGVFRDVTLTVGLGTLHSQTQSADWADFDNDGYLDLYVGNENSPNQLFRNTGVGTFVDVASRAGVTNLRYAKGVAWGDFDEDRYPDLYVSNLGGLNRLYHNNQDGTFTDIAASAKVSYPLESFPVWFWDFNNDGALDIFVGAYDLKHGMEGFVADFLHLPHDAEVDCLYQGDGKGNFLNVAKESGVGRVTLPMGSNFGDIDGDGFLDYYLGTGYTEYDALLPNRAFLNDAGKQFRDVSMASGLSHLQKGHGVSISDIDNDGDNDLFIVLGGAFPGDGFTNALFENPGFGNHGITIRLVGTKTNRNAIGARIRIVLDESGQKRTIYRWISSGGSFGGNSFRQLIGIGKADKIDLIEVNWPTSASNQTFRDVAIDQSIEITEGQPDFRTISAPTFHLKHQTHDD
ncbi:MAG: CRTAC1 family protein [Planctomycetota bacterium]|nr:CRTAC1 family protein [Planctomycetota bacterium]